jgi:capsular exopolysaccharide synthesis family protein
MEDPSLLPPVSETTLIKSGKEAREPSAPLVFQLGNSDQNSAGAFSVSLLLKSLRQRIFVTIPLGIILAAIASTALWYFSEDKYLATATLEIMDKQPFLAFPTMEQSGNFSQTQVELLKEPYLIGKAIEKENLMDLPEIQQIKQSEDAVAWITQRLKVLQVGRSQLYRVSFLTKHPTSAQKVVSAIVNVYKKYHESETDEQRDRMLELLKAEHKVRDGEIELKRQKYRDMVRNAGGETAAAVNLAGAGGTRALAARDSVLVALQEKLITADVDIELKMAELAFLREHIEKPVTITDEQIDAEINGESHVIDLERQARDLRLKLAARNPETSIAQTEKKNLEALEKRLADHKAKLRVEFAVKLKELATTEGRDLVARAEAELENRRKLAGMLRDKLQGEIKQKSDHGDKSLEVEFAHDELSRAEEVSRRISDRMVVLQTESRALSPVKIVAEAKLPTFPEGPSLTKKLAMVGLAGFFAPMMLFVGWDLLYRRVYEREQLQHEVKVKFVSEVAALPIRSLIPRPGSSKEFKQQSLMFEESVNALRTTLSVDKALEGCRVFVMASAVSGEGKTNLSSQLAMSWSQAEPGKVILVDADLRSPNVHELFEVRSGPGLAEVLRGECSLEDATIMDWGDRLYILPAGNLGSDSASQLFSGAAFLDLMAKLRAQYNKIMVDVPPVLCASETLLIAKEADGVLMCALHDYSRTGQIKQAYDRLAVAGVNVVGAVLNGAPVRQYSYNYRGYGVN